MLTFISDIHLTDETAFPSYLPARAVEEVFFNNLVSILRRRTAVKELSLVILGDFFDLIRTKKWWSVRKGKWRSEAVTPWSENQKGLEESALRILENIIKKNSDILTAIRQLPDRLTHEVPSLESASITYVLGNHDRLISLPLLKKAARASLGNASLVADGFLSPTGYRTLALHGHQLDRMNREDAGMPPIGDLISSLVTAIPYWIESAMKQEGFSSKTVKAFKDKMLRIDDVRPHSAILPWLVSEAKKEEQKSREFLKDFIIEQLAALAEDDFVLKWIEAHDKEFGAIDEFFNILMSIQGGKILSFLGKKFMTLDNLAKIVNKLRGENGEDTYAKTLLAASNKKFARGKSPFEWTVQQRMDDADCVVMGHTHGSKYVPLNARFSYLNTGTWRNYALQSFSGGEFIPSDRLTFVTVYKKGEAEARRFEQWNALMSRSDDHLHTK